MFNLFIIKPFNNVLQNIKHKKVIIRLQIFLLDVHFHDWLLIFGRELHLLKIRLCKDAYHKELTLFALIIY